MKLFHVCLVMFPADVQQLAASGGEVPSEGLDCGGVLDREGPPELPHTEEELWSPSLHQEKPPEERREELWTGGKGEQLEELVTAEFTFSAVSVKSEEEEEEEDDDEEEENRQDPWIYPQQIHRTESEFDGETHGSPELDNNSNPDQQPRTPNNSDDNWASSRGQTMLQTNHKAAVRDEGRKYDGKRHVVCPECGKRYRRSSMLTAHMRTHTGERPFACSLCGKSFSYRGSLHHHQVVHRDEKPFRCSVCLRDFSRKETLQRHMATHTGDKPFGCPICAKRFSRNSTLRLHLCTHTGEKPFGCPFCDKRFLWKKLYRSHVKMHGAMSV